MFPTGHWEGLDNKWAFVTGVGVWVPLCPTHCSGCLCTAKRPRGRDPDPSVVGGVLCRWWTPKNFLSSPYLKGLAVESKEERVSTSVGHKLSSDRSTPVDPHPVLLRVHGHTLAVGVREIIVRQGCRWRRSPIKALGPLKLLPFPVPVLASPHRVGTRVPKRVGGRQIRQGGRRRFFAVRL